MKHQEIKTMQRVYLASRPDGAVTPENFGFETTALPSPGENQVLVRVHYMSLDPYMRIMMDDIESYQAPTQIGETMTAGGVGEVITSNSPDYQPGDFVMGSFGWATHACADASKLVRVDPEIAPISTSLSVLGMPGLTAWFGLRKFADMTAGETLVVAAASGPVGSMVGQLAKLAGLRVVGIAGGPEKCALVRDRFGFDACIDHRAYDSAADLEAALKEVCPDGIDIYFENVGGKVFEAVFPLLNPFGRIQVCGAIAWYDENGPNANPVTERLALPELWRVVNSKFLSINGFVIGKHFDELGNFITEIAPLVKSGKIAYLEDVAEGLENAPEAFASMLKGGNTGKQLVKLI